MGDDGGTAKIAGYTFDTRLNAPLDANDFDGLVEGQCVRLYAPMMRRAGLPSGAVLRLILFGFLRAVRSFTRLPVDEPHPNSHDDFPDAAGHRPRESPRRAVFTRVQKGRVAAALLKDKTVAVDATLREANAAMHSIVLRDTGESYQEFLTALAQSATRAELARLDRQRKKKPSKVDWKCAW